MHRTRTRPPRPAAPLAGLLLAGAVLALPATDAWQDGAAAPPGSCLASGCHEEVARHGRLHAPVARGRCDHCHEPVPGGTPFEPGERHAFRSQADSAAPCTTCHEHLDVEAYVHEPVKQGLCILCHDPHGAEQAFLLRAGTDRELCAQCHRECFAGAAAPHGPVGRGACSACHDPHQSGNRFRLRGDGTLRCGVCHLGDVAGILGAATTHRPVREDCANCHEPHAGTNPFRLILPPPRLCLDCHEAIRTRIQTGSVVHRPVLEGKCLDCHEHHGSDCRRLLRGNFTGETYEPFDLGSYALCYRCHLPTQVTEARTETATGFRNGDVNLHFLHVNQSEKGRTCNACHQVHAAATRLIREGTPFGIWQIPLSFQKTETGGRCLPACHKARGYDRLDPVDNR